MASLRDIPPLHSTISTASSSALGVKVKMKIAVSIILSVLICTGCSTLPPLNKWVEDRGYHFHKDYSSINTLGWHVEGSGNLSPSPMLIAIDHQKGDIPDISTTKNLNLHIEGKAATQQFLKAIAAMDSSADFETAYSAEILLNKPFKSEATALFPISSCVNKEITVVTSVLNTGNMVMTIFDEQKKNITGKFTVKQVEGRVALKGDGRDTRLEIGKNLYVGYFPQRYRCTVISTNADLIIAKGKAVHFGGVDFQYLQYHTGEDAAGFSIPIAETYIVPSGYYESQGNTSALLNSSYELAELLQDQAVSARLVSLEQQISTVVPENQKLQTEILTERLEQQKAKSQINDLLLSTLVMIALGTDIGGSGVGTTAMILGLKGQLDQLKSREAQIAQERAENVPQLRHQLSEQSKVVEKKSGLLARALTLKPQVLTHAKRYSLSFGLQLSIPGKRPNSGVYIEVKNVDKEKVQVRVQHLLLERIE